MSVVTRLLPAHSEAELVAALPAVLDALRSGKPVALPTETVYGLAADALQASAVARIFEAKERPFFDPLICHLPSREWVARLTLRSGGKSGAVTEALLERFWPGPLTVVLPRNPEVVPDLVAAGLPTVALRMSAHPVFQRVVEAFGRPLAAPSANRFGRISPTTAAHALSELAGRIPLVLDAGATRHGVESTIVRVREDGVIEVLRPGPVTHDELRAFGFVRQIKGALAVPDAPGQLASHYAPRAPLVLLDAAGDAPSSGCGLLALARSRIPAARAAGYAQVEYLSSTGDPLEAAANLFAAMRRLDDAGVALIVAERAPATGLGIAINDRLSRAATR